MKRKFLNEIEGFEDYDGYSVTEEGKVYSHFKRYDKEWQILKEPVRELKPTADKKGYLKVRLSSNGNKKSASVHRLTALAFIDNPDNLPQVDHIDANKLNNSVENLEWVTGQENHRRKMEMGLNIVKSGEEHYMRVRNYQKDEFPCCKEIVQYDIYGNFIAEYKSVKTAGEENGIDKTSISKALKGHIKTAGGFIWKYKNQEGSTTIENIDM